MIKLHNGVHQSVIVPKNMNAAEAGDQNKKLPPQEDPRQILKSKNHWQTRLQIAQTNLAAQNGILRLTLARAQISLTSQAYSVRIAFVFCRESF